MADVTLMVSQVGKVARVCVQCGRPAGGTCRVRIAGPTSGVGYMVGGAAAAPLDNLEKMANSRGRVELPACWWHRWIVPPSVEAKPAGPDRVTVSGACERFVAAVRRGS